MAPRTSPATSRSRFRCGWLTRVWPKACGLRDVSQVLAPSLTSVGVIMSLNTLVQLFSVPTRPFPHMFLLGVYTCVRVFGL